MQIWIDADACPKTIKEIVFRAAIRTKTQLTLVSNQSLTIPQSPYIQKMQVGGGFDVADNAIINKVQVGDLVITADIPLADAIVTKGAKALNPRGELYSVENIKQRLAMRNFSTELRNTGVTLKGPPKLSPREIQRFANSLDRFLTG
jgi:uncharacterized protein YaiI (UPF0178 family)